MSGNLLWHSGKMYTLTDDLESLLHVLGWITLRFLPAIGTYDGHNHSYDMGPFHEHYEPCGISNKGVESVQCCFWENIHRPIFSLERKPRCLVPSGS